MHLFLNAMEKEYILISACLAGVNCRYDGTNKENEKILNIIKENRAILVCPEQMGGLKTPREASEILGEKVLTINGEDVTYFYLKGAEEILKLVKKFNIKKAILKSKSPSCGVGLVYDGTFSGNLVKGTGVTAKILLENDVDVITENDL